MCVLKDEGLAALASRQVEPASPRRPVTSLAALRSRFSRNEEGSVAMVFGLMAVPCVMLIGFAVDFSRLLAVHQQTQGMLDNAALAGAKATQGATGNLDTIAQAAASSFWSAHKDQIKNAIPTAASVTYSSNGAKTELTWTVTQWVQTPFLHAGSLISNKAAEGGAPSGCSSSGWQCQKVQIKSTSLVQAGGNNKDTNVETSLMLDITGSMAGQKLTDLKLAAKDLIDIVVWNDQSKVKSRVALSPFSSKVNLGSAYVTAVSGASTSRACVTERTGADAYTDEAPAAGRWIPSASCSGSDPTSSEAIIPLSTNKTALKARVDSLTDGGATAGHLGTAWAWYALSPKWNTIWPTASQGEGYDKISTGKLRKIAVLMTDGDYNTQYSPTDSQTQASQLCTNMKATGIEVYTIGFQVSNAAKTFLQGCATDTSHYYDATTGDALRMAFRDIALKISSIRITGSN
jgi:Flp pilus assembly protein TadG